MQRKLLLLLRISKPEYNKTLYQDYKIFMNCQKNFRNPDYNKGQYDKYEGAILQGPCTFKYYVDGKQKCANLGNDGIIYKENNAYVFCMYEIDFDKLTYDSKTNKFYHNISWDYIKDLWHDKGLVKYDLQDKLHSQEYFELALKDDFEAVYHKVDAYKEQKEYRLTIMDDGEEQSYILQLEKDDSLMFDIFPLKYGKNIIVEISNLEFNTVTNLPDRFSAKLSFYEPEKPIEKYRETKI